MGETEDSEAVDLQWGRFAAIIAAGFVWLVVSSVSFKTMIDPAQGPAGRLTAAAVFIAPLLLWLVLVGRTIRRGDEFDRMLEVRSLAAGCIHIVTYSGLVMVNTVCVELAGRLAPGAARNQAAIVGALAPLAMILGQTLAQMERLKMSREDR